MKPETFAAMSFNEFHDWYMETVPEIFWKLHDCLWYTGPSTFETAVERIHQEYASGQRVYPATAHREV